MKYEIDMLHAVLRKDLFAFVDKSFNTLHPNSTFVPAWHVEAMCHMLQKVAEREIRRLLITVPPRHLKSICTSVCLSAWLLGKHPSLKVMVASYGQDLASRHARDFRAITESPWYRELFPEMVIDPRKNTEGEIMTTRRGGRKAVSLGGAVTGFGADVLIVDDLLKAADAQSETERQRAKDFYDQTLFSRLDDKSTGRIIAIQQRTHEDDFAGYLLEKGNFVHLNLPAIAEQTETVDLPQGRQHTRRKGEALFTEREPLETLEETRREIGDYAFSCQYQQNPVPLGGNRIRWDWFGIYEELPDRSQLQLVVQSWDTAVTAEPTSDYSVCTTWGFREGTWYLLDVLRERLEYPALKRRVLALQQEWNADKVIIEHAASGIPLLQEIRNEVDHRGTYVGYRPAQDKEVRVAAQTAKLEGGTYLLPESAPWIDDFKHELLAFPAGRYDDQVDSMIQFLEWYGSRKGRGWSGRRLNGGRRPGRRRR